MNKILIVAKYEYLKTVKRLAFWISTLLFPAFIAVIMVVSGISSIEGSKKLEQIAEDIKEVHVIDSAGIIAADLVTEPLFMKEDLQESIDKLKGGEIDGVLYYPEDILENGTFKVFAQDKGLFGSIGFSTVGGTLIAQSAVGNIQDETLQQIISQNFSDITYLFDENGNEVDLGIEKFIVPGISGIVFFISIVMSGNYMLQSVAEEKENRMIENLLSMISSKTLIFGKIFGLSGAVLTQLVIWFTLAFGIISFGSNSLGFDLPFDLSKIPLEALPLNIFFILIGFLLFAAVMVGVGAIGTSYKDSQSLSSVFIILSVLPLYFITILIADPNGTIAQIVSYFPFTSPMVFLIRNSITSMPPLELLFGVAVNIIYVTIAMILAFKLFDLGALMYHRRPKMKEILYVLTKRG